MQTMWQTLSQLHLFQEQKWKERGAQRGSRAQNVDVTQVDRDVDDNSLNEEVETCKHFFVDSEIESGINRAYNFAMYILDLKYLLEKLDVVSDTIKGAAHLNVAFGFLCSKTSKIRDIGFIMHTKKIHI